jgi:hypothetical protein
MSSINFAKVERIDVHSHAITPKYRKFLIQNGHQNPDGMPEIPVDNSKISHLTEI